MTLFTGAGTALVTPFRDGKVDFASLGSLIDWQIQENIDAIIVCGTTGEASTLDDDEHVETVAYAVDRVAGRVPVIAGAGSNDTRHAIQLSKDLKKIGADGLLLVTPYYNKCSQKGLIAHYKAIAESIEIPMILYSVPGRTGVNISPFVVKELCTHPNIVGIKEASGNIAQVVEIAAYISDDFSLYSGNDDMVVPLLSVGGIGVISVLSNVVPKETHEMVMAFLNGDLKKSMQMQLTLKPLIDALFCEVSPIPVKAALCMMGKLKQEYRLPLCDPSLESLARIEHELLSLGLVKE